MSLKRAYLDVIQKLGVLEGEFLGKVVQEKGYTLLKDGDYSVTLEGYLLPEAGSLVRVKGFLYYDWKNSFFVPRLNVVSYEVLDKEDSGVELYIREKPAFWSYLWSLLEEKGVIRIALVHGVSAQTGEDFLRAFYQELGPYRDKVFVDVYEVFLHDDALAEFFGNVADYDLYCLVRGGGKEEDLKRVGGLKTVKVIADRQLKLLLGLGHTFDAALSELEKVAVGVIRPPARLGSDLGKFIYMFYDYHFLKSRKFEEEFSKNLSHLEQQLKELLEINRHLEALKSELEVKLKEYEGRDIEFQRKFEELNSTFSHQVSFWKKLSLGLILLLLLFFILFFGRLI